MSRTFIEFHHAATDKCVATCTPKSCRRTDELSGTVSLPFAVSAHKRAAAKLIDPRGNEAMRVRRLDGAAGGY